MSSQIIILSNDILPRSWSRRCGSACCPPWLCPPPWWDPSTAHTPQLLTWYMTLWQHDNMASGHQFRPWNHTWHHDKTSWHDVYKKTSWNVIMTRHHDRTSWHDIIMWHHKMTSWHDIINRHHVITSLYDIWHQMKSLCDIMTWRYDVTRSPPVARVTVELRVCPLTPRVHVVGAGDGLAAIMASEHGEL